MTINVWYEQETPDGSVEYMVTWDYRENYLHVRKGDRSITMPSARLIAQYYDFEHAVNALAKELNASS